MKILILSIEKQYEIERLIEEAKKMGHEAQFVRLGKKTQVNPKEYDALLVRAIRGMVPEAKKIAKKFKALGKTVVDEKICFGIDRDKMENYELIANQKLFVPKTCYFTKKNLAKIMTFEEDLVLKPSRGKRGQGILRAGKKDLERLVKKIGKGKDYICQEFVEIKEEYRVYAIGGKAVGGMKKVTDNWIHNVYMGAKPVKTELSKKMRQTAVKAALAVQTEIAGIDIGITKKGLFVIEVNRSPGFKGFESIGNNLAKKIVEYVEQKNRSKKLVFF